jgi:S1-C subfamily serine protease
MEKKSQPQLVVWVGMMLVLMLGIGIVGFIAQPQPATPSPAPSTLNSSKAPPDNSSVVAYGTPNLPANVMPSPQDSTAVALDNSQAQLADGANEITVSIYDQGDGPGQARFLGSGVIVTEECVLTNAHIVNNKSHLFVHAFAPRPATIPTILFRCDTTNDLAVLRTSNNSKFSSVALLGNPNELVAGDTVFAMGNPHGNGNQLMDGLLIDKNFPVSVNGQMGVRMRTNITISTGLCGGPLVNTKGEVIGIGNSLGNPETVTPINKALPLIYGKAQSQTGSTAPTQVV